MTARSPRRVFLVGFYGVHNLGDEAIRDAIVAAAPTHGAEVVAVASRDRSDPDPRAVPMSGPGLVRYLRAILRADRVVLGGGGILKDEGLRVPLELFATALGARILRREVALLAVGVGPFYSRPGRWLAKATARLARVRTVRDAASVQSLSDLGVRGVRLGADPTFGPGDEPAQARPDAPHPVTRDRDVPHRPRALVSLRPWFLREPDRDLRQRALRQAVGAAVAPLVVAGWDVEMLSLYWPRDHDEAVALAADPRLPGATAPAAELDWAGLMDRVRAADLVVAMRYHAVAAAAQSGRPTIALAYEPKVRSLATELGLPVVAVDDPDLASRLRLLVDEAASDPAAAVADPAALGELRERAAMALEAALGDWP